MMRFVRVMGAMCLATAAVAAGCGDSEGANNSASTDAGLIDHPSGNDAAVVGDGSSTDTRPDVLDSGLESGPDATDTGADAGPEVTDGWADVSGEGEPAIDGAVDVTDAGSSGSTTLNLPSCPPPNICPDGGVCSYGLVGITFDGTNAWVTSEWGWCVYKIDVASRNIIGMYHTGNGAQYDTFDGTSVWVTNAGTNIVTKIDPITGGLIGNYTTGNGPDGLVFDGANIWTANYWDGTVTKLRASDGQFLGTFWVGQHTTTTHPRFIATDGTLTSVGTFVWVTNSGEGTILKLSVATGALVDTFDTGGPSSFPYAIVYDGTYLWVTRGIDSTVAKLRGDTGQIVGTYPAGQAPNGIRFDGTYVWISDQGLNNQGTVTQILASTGDLLATHPVGYRTQDVGCDGRGYVWAMNGGDVQGNAGTQSITIFPIN